MIKPQEPENEQERLDDLHSYSILDTLSEDDYNNLTTIAAEICQTKISLISLIDDKRQWFKSRHGLDATETPKDYAFCAHAINHPQDFFNVEDARSDERFHDNPLVVSEPHVIFYAGFPLISEAGFPLGTLCVIDDKPKVLNQNQIASLKALSKQVMNLIELKKKKMQLESTMDTVKEKNRELEQFAFVAAHDLKSPLNSISGFVELLGEYTSQIDPRGQKMLEVIKHSVSKLKDLITGLLEYSRSDKAFVENKTHIDLESFKRDIIFLFVQNDSIKISFKNDIDSLFVSKTGFDQIMINLLANAIKYNDKTITEIEISVSENRKEYEFIIKDNGPGIPSKYHEKIFELFETTACRDKFGDLGNGIGLALVKKMIEKLGGTIRVESATGEGARFIFTLKK